MGGVFADVLETKQRKLFLGLTGMALVAQAVMCVVSLPEIATVFRRKGTRCRVSRYKGEFVSPLQIARRRAARASRRVESRVGSGELVSFMRRGISVQPRTTASQPSIFHACDDLLEVGDGFGREDAVDELVEDDAIDFVAVGGVGANVLETVGGEFFGVDFALDQIARSGEADAVEATVDGVFGDYLGDVQPGERGLWEDVGECLMDGVVGADEEVGADGG